MEEPRNNGGPLDINEILGSTASRMTHKTFIGTTRTFNNLERKDWLFLVLSLVSIVICIALTISRLCTVQSNSSDFTYGLLLLLSSVFCIYYVIHGVFKERADELGIFIISTLVVMIYCVANIISSHATPSSDIIKFIRLGVISIMGPVVIVLGVILMWDYFRTNSLIIRTFHDGNPETVSMARKYFLCSSLLKFELQMQLSMDLLVMKSGPKNLSNNSEDIIFLAVGIVLTLVWVSIGFLALRLEKTLLAYIFYILSLFEAASIIYRLYVTHKSKSLEDDNMYVSTFACGIIALVFWMCLLFYMMLAMQNFKKGLMARAYGNGDAVQSTTEDASHQ